jgi:hypothetical protein
MKSLVVLAIVLFATKKVAEFLLSFFCVLLFGYGSYVLIRDFRKPRFLCSQTPARLP